jgi:lipoprotein-anchoring transpeptidase ErfK/SrfK
MGPREERTPGLDAALAQALIQPTHMVRIPPTPPVWQGQAARAANVRSAPRRDAPIVRQLNPGEPVRATRWVTGDEIEPDNPTWAEIAAGQFVFAMLLRAVPPAESPTPPAGSPTQGKWVDVNLTLQVATAYEGTTPVRTVLVSTGRPGWETAEGTARIIRRVEKETMDGATLRGQGPGGRGASYRVENVRWTQYFSMDGSAVHENSWRRPDAFGIPGSHGCIGLPPAEAAWFWNWAVVGTPLIIHR